jgi:hypothetical protein
MALFFCPPFFCHFKCTTDISVDVNMPFNVNAFQGDQNVVEYWIPDARTPAVTEPPPKNFDLKTRVTGGFGSPLCSVAFVTCHP